MLRPIQTTTALLLVHLLFGSQLVAQSPSANPVSAWHSFPNCPVLVEQVVEVPALESGLLESFEVELNQSLEKGQTIAQLDRTLAEMDLRLAQLQHESAQNLANDNSDLEYHKLALKEVEEELSSFRKIETSVSDSEIRRLTLGVAKARLAVVRSSQARTRAGVEAQLKQASVEAAQQRLARRTIACPMNGVISKILKRPGQWVEAGEPVVIVTGLDQLVVDCLVPVKQIKLDGLIGARVVVDLVEDDGTSTRFAGQISSYDHVVSSQGIVRVHARITNQQKAGHWLLLPGMNVTLHLSKEHLKSKFDELNQAPPKTRLTAQQSPNEE